MHIPDGFLSVLVSLVFWAVSVLVIAVALRRVNRQLNERQVPLMGVLAAAIFAGQMLNFSVTGGTSGHLLGAALATILLGPWPAVLVMTCVVSVQALLFQDGGILALGANLFNMAVVGVFVSWAACRLLRRILGGQALAVSWRLPRRLDLDLHRLACLRPAAGALRHLARQDRRSGHGRHPRPHRRRRGPDHRRRPGFPAGARRDLLEAGPAAAAADKAVIAAGFVLALLLAVLSPLASSHPDGLEWVAGQNGFLGRARHALF